MIVIAVLLYKYITYDIILWVNLFASPCRTQLGTTAALKVAVKIGPIDFVLKGAVSPWAS